MKTTRDTAGVHAGRRTLLAATGVAVLLPTAWRRPLVESVILPAHAQASLIAFSSPTLRNARSETRIPSGSGAVEALDSVRFSACITLPDIPVSCSAVANLGSGVAVDIGSASAVSNNANFFTVDLQTPAITVAPVGAITEIEITCEALGVVDVTTITALQLSSALAGTVTPAPGCA